MYLVLVYCTIARSRAIYDSFGTLIIVIRFRGQLIMEVFCRNCYYLKKGQEKDL